MHNSYQYNYILYYNITMNSAHMFYVLTMSVKSITEQDKLSYKVMLIFIQFNIITASNIYFIILQFHSNQILL